MPVTETLALTLPFLVGGVVVGAAKKLRPALSLAHLAFVGVLIGSALSLALLVGAPSLPPANAAEWTWVALVMGALLALVPGTPGAFLVAIVAGGSVLALAQPLMSGDDKTLALAAAVLLALGALGVARAPRDARNGARARAGGVAVLFLALGVTLSLSGSVRYAFLAFGAGLAIGGLALASLLIDDDLGRAPVAMAVALYAVVAAMGALYVETPFASKGAVITGPLFLALGTPLIERLLGARPRLVVLAGAAAVLVPLIVAVAAAALAFEPDPYAGYR